MTFSSQYHSLKSFITSRERPRYVFCQVPSHTIEVYDEEHDCFSEDSYHDESMSMSLHEFIDSRYESKTRLNIVERTSHYVIDFDTKTIDFTTVSHYEYQLTTD